MADKFTFDVYEDKLSQQVDEIRIRLIAIHEKNPQSLKNLAKAIGLSFNTLKLFLGGEEIATRSLLKIVAYVKKHEVL